MKHWLLAVGIGSVVLPVSAVQADPIDVCPSFGNQVVEPITIDAALARFMGVTLTKDEFETSAQL